MKMTKNMSSFPFFTFQKLSQLLNKKNTFSDFAPRRKQKVYFEAFTKNICANIKLLKF